MDALRNKIERILNGVYGIGTVLYADLGESIEKCQVKSYNGNKVYHISLLSDNSMQHDVNEENLFPITHIFAKDDKKPLDEILPAATLAELKKLTVDILEYKKIEKYVSETVKKLEADLETAHITEEMKTRFSAEAEKVDKILQEAHLTSEVLDGIKYTASDIQERTVVKGGTAEVKEVVSRLSALVAKKSREEFDKIAEELFEIIEANIKFKADLDKEIAKQVKEKVKKENPAVIKTEVPASASFVTQSSVKDILNGWLASIKKFTTKLLAKVLPEMQENRKELEDLHSELKEALGNE